METICPLNCLSFCQESFIQKHETFILTVIASGSTVLGMVFAYLLKSRCSNISVCGIGCDRTIPPDTPIRSSTV